MKCVVFILLLSLLLLGSAKPTNCNKGSMTNVLTVSKQAENCDKKKVCALPCSCKVLYFNVQRTEYEARYDQVCIETKIRNVSSFVKRYIKRAVNDFQNLRKKLEKKAKKSKKRKRRKIKKQRNSLKKDVHDNERLEGKMFEFARQVKKLCEAGQIGVGTPRRMLLEKWERFRKTHGVSNRKAVTQIAHQILEQTVNTFAQRCHCRKVLNDVEKGRKLCNKACGSPVVENTVPQEKINFRDGPKGVSETGSSQSSESSQEKQENGVGVCIDSKSTKICIKERTTGTKINVYLN